MELIGETRVCTVCGKEKDLVLSVERQTQSVLIGIMLILMISPFKSLMVIIELEVC